MKNFLQWILDTLDSFGLFSVVDKFTYSKDEMTFSTKRELTEKQLQEIKEYYYKHFSGVQGGYRSLIMPPTVHDTFKPINNDKHIKVERCKSCGQNESDYTYRRGVYKCNYCGTLQN